MAQKHPHAVSQDKEDPYVALVHFVFHLARKRYGWTKDKMELEYRQIYREWCESTKGYTELPLGEQRMLCCLAMARKLCVDELGNGHETSFTFDKWVV